MEVNGIEWRLVKKVTEPSEEITDTNNRSFEFDDLEVSKEHELHIPIFQQELEDKDIEIFAMRGHQFMTDDGVYRIVKKINDTQYD
jgi:hypothetical protein